MSELNPQGQARIWCGIKWTVKPHSRRFDLLMKNPWKTRTSRIIYKNNWISLREDEVIRPDGQGGIYGVVQFKSLAVGILPLNENYETWIVGQYRYALEEYSWEIPEGGSEAGESALECAKRELQEEVGLEAGEYIKVLEGNLSNSVTDERCVSFVAKDLKEGVPQPEGTEVLSIKKLSFDKLVRMADRGEIKDGLSLMTIYKVKYMIDSGSI